MSQLNTANVSNPNFYSLGRGKLYFSFLSNDLPTTWRDLGNCPSFNINSEEEEIEHKSSREGLAVTDKTLTISRTTNLTFDLDELSFENLAFWFSGAATANAPADTINYQTAPYGDEPIFGTGSEYPTYVLNQWYELKDTEGQRLYYLDQLTSYSIELDGTPDTALVEGTDYLIEEEAGLILFKSGGAVTAGSSIINFTASNANDIGIDKVRAFALGSITGAMKFVAINPANGDAVREYQFHKVSVASDGDLSLIGDEFSTMSFSGTVERNETADSGSPFVTIRGLGSL